MKTVDNEDHSPDCEGREMSGCTIKYWGNTCTAEKKILKRTASICQVNSEGDGLLMMEVQIVKLWWSSLGYVWGSGVMGEYFVF